MRFLYFVGFLGFCASLLVNVWTLAGHDAWNALAVTFVVSGALHAVLRQRGFYSLPVRGWGVFLRPFDTGGIEDDGLPPWSRYPVCAVGLYAALGVALTFWYIITHGEVHGGLYSEAPGISRPATAFEIWREDCWWVFGLSSLAAWMNVHPALHFLFDRRGA